MSAVIKRPDLEVLIERSKRHPMTDEELAEQRQSWVRGEMAIGLDRREQEFTPWDEGCAMSDDLENLDLRPCAACEDDTAVEGGDLCAACKARGGEMSEWNAERIAALLEPLTGYTPGPWKIQRRHIRADQKDVEYEQQRSLRKGETRRDLKVGDSLGTTVQNVGPISPDHCHWAGYHLSIDDADAELTSAAPDLVDALRAVATERDAALARAEKAKAECCEWKQRHFKMRDERDKANIVSCNYGRFATENRERAEKAEAEVERLREALSEIAKQKRTDELETEYDVECADFEGGYDLCIDRARAALAQEAGR